MIRQQPVLSAVSIGAFVAALLIETDLEEYGVTVAIYICQHHVALIYHSKLAHMVLML